MPDSSNRLMRANVNQRNGNAVDRNTEQTFKYIGMIKTSNEQHQLKYIILALTILFYGAKT